MAHDAEFSEEFAARLRVKQSVGIIQAMPVLLLGNPAGVMMIALFDFGTFISSYAFIPSLILILLMVPPALSYLKHRDAPPPERVSRRRIRRIVFHSLLMGGFWALTIALLAPQLDALGQALVLTVMAFIWYGAVALVSSIPKAVTAYVLPGWLATFLSMMVEGTNDRVIITVWLAAAAIAVTQTSYQNWKAFRKSVELEHELARKSAFQERLSGQLAKYLSPQVYDQIFLGRQEVRIASQRKKLTVFFSDIERFTEITDRMESEDLTDLLNQYLTEMSKIALEYGATIDKYVGDAIVIFFGDPDTKGVREDALACVRMAIAMRERMSELEHIWREQGIEKPLRCRMGIHTDFCTVGNFGSEDRMDYTIIGGGVNTASRLENLAGPGEILISYETYAHVQGEILCEERGEVDVKGMAYPVAVYRVLDAADTAGAMQLRYREQSVGMSLDMNLAAMGPEGRAEAERMLRRALDRLEAPDGGAKGRAAE